MSKAPQWTTEAPPGIDLGATTIDQANEMVGTAGFQPLPRGTLNALYRAGWGRADLVLYGDAKDLVFKSCIGVKRLDEVDRWRTSLLSVVTPDGEAMSTAERVVLNLMRRRGAGAVADTAELLHAIREMRGTEHLRELLVELALLVPPRAFAGEMRQWLLEVARG